MLIRELLYHIEGHIIGNYPPPSSSASGMRKSNMGIRTILSKNL